MNDIGLFFEFEGTVIQLPINPEKLEISYPGNNKNVEIIKLGQVSILKKKKLGTIKFSSWFPYESWWTGVRTSGQFESADYYKAFFMKLQDEAKPARFIVSGYNYNTLVSVEKFSYHYQGGDYEDCYYTLELKEYVPYHVRVLTPNISPEVSGEDSNTSDVEEVRVVNKDRPVVLPEKITIGCSVILNGTLHDFYTGNGNVGTKSNYKCKVLMIMKEATCPYHLADEQGNWLGWAEESAVKLA